jgi:hypothetical protein
MTADLQAYVIRSSQAAGHAYISELANIIGAKHKDVMAVLAYGSALRDANPENTLIDYYVLTETIEGVSDHFLSRMLCQKIPPNVYYAETFVDGKNYRCKYAVMPMELLAKKLKPTTANPYFWVRFAQPMQIVWTKDDLARKRVQQLLIRAMETANAHARELAPDISVRKRWVELFRNTYRTECRHAARTLRNHFQICEHSNTSRNAMELAPLARQSAVGRAFIKSCLHISRWC